MEAYETPVMEVVEIEDELVTDNSPVITDNVKPSREESL